MYQQNWSIKISFILSVDSGMREMWRGVGDQKTNAGQPGDLGWTKLLSSSKGNTIDVLTSTGMSGYPCITGG